MTQLKKRKIYTNNKIKTSLIYHLSDDRQISDI